MSTNRQRKLPLKNGVGKPCIYCKRTMLAQLPENEFNPIIRGLSAEEVNEKEIAARALHRRMQSVSIEHLMPRAKGGTNEADNLTHACARCNSLRGHMSYDVFSMFAKFVLQEHPDAPTIYLRAALVDFLTSLAELAVQNRREARKAVDYTLKELRKNLKNIH